MRIGRSAAAADTCPWRGKLRARDLHCALESGAGIRWLAVRGRCMPLVRKVAGKSSPSLWNPGPWYAGWQFAAGACPWCGKLRARDLHCTLDSGAGIRWLAVRGRCMPLVRKVAGTRSSPSLWNPGPGYAGWQFAAGPWPRCGKLRGTRSSRALESGAGAVGAGAVSAGPGCCRPRSRACGRNS